MGCTRPGQIRREKDGAAVDLVNAGEGGNKGKGGVWGAQDKGKARGRFLNFFSRFFPIFNFDKYVI